MLGGFSAEEKFALQSQCAAFVAVGDANYRQPCRTIPRRARANVDIRPAALPGPDAARSARGGPVSPGDAGAVTTDSGIIAIHRTFLDSAQARLAGFERPKRALGSLGSGAVRLARPVQGRLGLAEGIESALSAMKLFGIPCWATLGNERFGLVSVPESVRELYLFIDNDAGGTLAKERARKAYVAPHRVIHSRAPASPGFDWNDELKSRLARLPDPSGRGEGAIG